jgi:succinyl-diaminopimelate desuccinylase
MTEPRAALAAELAELTLDLMRVPSPTGHEEAIADLVVSRLGTRGGARVARHGRSVVAFLGEGSPLVVLAGHLDTVPEQGHPEPAAVGSDLVGLGSSDMKSGLAVMLRLAESVAREGGRNARQGRLALVFYDGEEGPMSGNGLSDLFEREPDLGRADLAVLLEPTANAVELGCQGSLHARITFRGVAAHSARPWMGRNAIHLAAPFLSRVAGLPIREVAMGDALFREAMSVTLAQGGASRNVIPERFAVNLNLRFAPDRSVEEAKAHVATFIPPGADCEFVDAAPGAAPRPDVPLVRKFLEESGLPVKGKQAWTDVAQFAARGVPAFNFGPGLPELAHRRDERVPVENLVRAYRVLAGFLGLAEGEAGA